MDISLIILLIGGTILTIGDIVMKKWVVDNSNFLYFIGLLIYLIGLIFLVQSYKYKNIAIASAIFVIFNVITLLIVSWVFFKEGLSLIQIIGIVLGLISVVILEIS